MTLAIFGAGPLPQYAPLLSPRLPPEPVEVVDRIAERHSDRRAYLLSLIGSGGMSTAEIAAASGMSKRNVMRELRAMERADLIAHTFRAGRSKIEREWRSYAALTPDVVVAGTPTRGPRLRGKADGAVLDAVRAVGRGTVAKVAAACGNSRVYTWNVLRRLVASGMVRRYGGAVGVAYTYALADGGGA